MELQIIYTGLIAGLISLGKLAVIILPLMIIIEFIKQYGWLEKLSKQAEVYTRIFFLPGTAALPCLVGIFIGIISGSGIIIQTASETGLTRSQLSIVFVMVGICHSLFEETIIFVGTGVNVLILMTVRLILSLVLAYLLGWLIEHRLLIIKDTEMVKSIEK
jgi:hypothetical protein